MKKRIFSAAAAALLLLSGCADSASDIILPGTSDSGLSSVESTAETSKPTEEPAAAPSVVMSAESGVYAQGFSLELSSESGEILYTVDGSDPAVSETALVYSSPIAITDRSGDKNAVSAVDTSLIAGSFNEVNADKNGFVCTIGAPDDSAVDKCTVVRAAVKMPDGSFGEEAYSTYFI